MTRTSTLFVRCEGQQTSVRPIVDVHVYENAGLELNYRCYPLRILNYLKRDRSSAKRFAMAEIADKDFVAGSIVVGDLNEKGMDVLSRNVLQAMRNNPEVLFILLSSNQARVTNALTELANAGINPRRYLVMRKPSKAQQVARSIDTFREFLQGSHKENLEVHSAKPERLSLVSLQRTRSI